MKSLKPTVKIYKLVVIHLVALLVISSTWDEMFIDVGHTASDKTVLDAKIEIIVAKPAIANLILLFRI